MNEANDRLSNDLIGVAGVHFVAFKLSLRGLIVLPTIRNTAGIDLLVNDPRTGAQAALQVKTSMKRNVKFWPTSKPEKCIHGPLHYYVFLRFDQEVDCFEAFLETGAKVAAQVKANAQAYLDSGRKEFSYWELPQSEEEVQMLRNSWRDWKP
ncbi:MAG TPA: hypothetical protein VH592_24055 [Gemmataceae bacterium]